jgi:hypothetical protein
MDDTKIQNFLTTKVQLWETYHNHKENMANAGFLVQLSLFGAIMTGGLWPPKWVEKCITMPEIGTFLVYLVLWFIVHYYTRWQLINKRIAALYYAGFSQSFLYFSTNTLNDDDITIYHGETHKRNKMKDFISKIVYIPGGFAKMDASINNLPMFIAKRIEKQFNNGSGAETLEILITYASFMLVILVGMKIFMG